MQDTIQKPWGHELIIDQNNHYALKHIFINKGYRSSLQSHVLKHETIYVLHGLLELEIRDDSDSCSKEIFSAGEAYYIPPGTKHRVLALDDCAIVEVSTPQLDDVIRHKDDFGRVTV